MKIRKTNSHITALFSAAFFSLLMMQSLTLNSCRSLEKPEVYKDVDYTEEDAVIDEIASIRELAEKNTVKALWLSKLLTDRLPENEEAAKLFSDCLRKARKSVNDAEGEIDAFRIRESIAAVEGSKNTITPDFSKIPGLTPVEHKETKVSELIKGTVTVYVDKGIKLENGMGYTDMVLGSGFFISKNGYIVTNHHVIEDMVNKKSKGYSRLYIKLAEDPETRIPAKVIGWDSILDLALIKTEVDAPYVFTLGTSADLETGDKVYAIGSPLGLDRTLTSGIISATDRRLFTAGTVFQVDAAVNSGNSGGPLIDEKGRVQAIVFAGVQNYQGLNFAIPVEYLRNELPYLYAGGEREHPWAGAFGHTKRLPGSGAKNEGLTVQYMLPGGSAYLSGLKEDYTITAMNGIPINSLDDFQFESMKLMAGTIVRIEAQDEDGNKKEHLVYMEKRPQNPGYDIYRHDLPGEALYPILGMRLVHASSTSSRKYRVTKVIKSSAADEAGFSEGDPVILMDFRMNDDKSIAYVELQAKNRKNGYLEIAIGIPVTLDSAYYF